MKFLFSVIVYLLMAIVLGAGILLSVRGQHWLLIAAVIGYLMMLGLIGCLPKKISH
jgi:hypothetical protein